MAEMTMLSGLPGAGKDTWITRNLPTLPMVSLDQLREEMKVSPLDDQGPIVIEAKSRAKELLGKNHSFVFNATNLIESMRNKWINLAHQYKARVKIVYLEPPLEVIFNQNENRERVVPLAVISDMFDNLEFPNQTECHEFNGY